MIYDLRLGLVVALMALWLVMMAGVGAQAETAVAPPNIIVIFADDMGYGDIGPYNEAIRDTPHLDELAREGVLLTDFYVSASVCTPSRAGLLTGRHPIRTHTVFVLKPDDFLGLEPWEYTLAEALRAQGYTNGVVGKWHLGDDPQYLPTRQGFDSFFGIPYSNDSTRLHLLRDTVVVDSHPDQAALLALYTAEAKAFITAAQDGPFFLYMAHSAPHVPLYVADGFARPETHSLYEDVIQAMDWSVGEVMAHVEALGLGDNTIVIFTSDNGPAVGLADRIAAAMDEAGQVTLSEALPPILQQDNLVDEYGRSRWAGGQTGDLRGGKGTVYEGGVRTPFIVRWPAGLGEIPVGGRVVSEPTSSQDLYATLLTLAGGRLRSDRAYDSEDILSVWQGKGGRADKPLFFINGADWTPRALRWGRWKLHLDGALQPTALYDLSSVAGRQEVDDVLVDHPAVVAELMQAATMFSEEAHDRPWHQQTAVRLNRTDRRYFWLMGVVFLMIGGGIGWWGLRRGKPSVK